MSWLPWAIAAIVIGMLAFPILQIIPSHKQRAVIKLRQLAIGHSIKVNLRQPNIDKNLFHNYPELSHTVAYSLPIESQLRSSHQAIRSAEHGWLWQKPLPTAKIMQQINDLEANIPDFIQALEITSAGSTIFWNEHGDNETIDGILKVLSELNQLIEK